MTNTEISIQKHLENLLLNRKIRVDRFDADYVDDLEFILNENYNIYSLKDDTNSDFNEIKKLFPPHTENFIDYCNEIKKLNLDRTKLAPLISNESTKQEHRYNTTPTWVDSEGIKLDGDQKSIDIINNLQIEYSLQSGGTNLNAPIPWGNSSLFIAQNDLLDKLKKDKKLKILTIGPRWTSEVKFLRERFDADVIGLDLFTYDESCIVIGDMHNMEFEDNSFDVVYQRNTYNKSYDIRKALSEAVRVLKPGGVLISHECIDYVIGVNEIARTNITSNKWYEMCLRNNIEEIVMDVEIPSGNQWIKNEGTCGIKIKK